MENILLPKKETKKYLGLMNKKEMNEFLESIGGLENGWRIGEKPITDAAFFSVGYGWYPLIKDLISDLIELGWNKEVCQVKEKFGGLRFYINDATDEVHNRIREAENLSYNTCETCGEEGELRTDIGWYTTYCNKHYEERKSNISR
jgi:hypothetical protein